MDLIFKFTQFRFKINYLVDTNIYLNICQEYYLFKIGIYS